VAKYLLSKHLTVITNGPNISQILQRGRGITIIQTGGKLMPSIQSLVGPIAEDVLRRFNTDKAIIATAGVSSQEGLTNSSLEEIPIKQIAIERTREAIVVADSFKFGIKASTSGIPLDRIKVMVTDDKVPAEEKVRLEEKGIKVIIASE
jgi:DeoR/GlpR family transcriptional regulator of sugar metabolism